MKYNIKNSSDKIVSVVNTYTEASEVVEKDQSLRIEEAFENEEKALLTESKRIETLDIVLSEKQREFVEFSEKTKAKISKMKEELSKIFNSKLSGLDYIDGILSNIDKTGEFYKRYKNNLYIYERF